MKRISTVAALGLVFGQVFAQCIDTGFNAQSPAQTSDSLNQATMKANDDAKKNQQAKAMGGLAGGILGAVITQGSGSGLTKAVAVIGMGLLGATAGDILTKPVTDQNGNLVAQVGTDSRGQPIMRPVSNAMIRPGFAPGMLVTPEVYDDAVARASAPYPTPAMTGVNGAVYRTLDHETHCRLYGLMVETVATRAFAKAADLELDRAELARALDQSSKVKANDFAVANSLYAKAFKQYAALYQQTSQVLAIAAKGGFDVSAQQYLFSTVPGNLKNDLAAPISWPGVERKTERLMGQIHPEIDTSVDPLRVVVVE